MQISAAISSAPRAMPSASRSLCRDKARAAARAYAPPDPIAAMRQPEVTERVSADGKQHAGVPASAGVAYGRARVATELTDALAIEPGEVLVCRTTAPPWTPVFALASAVVTEGGTASGTAVRSVVRGAATAGADSTESQARSANAVGTPTSARTSSGLRRTTKTTPARTKMLAASRSGLPQEFDLSMKLRVFLCEHAILFR